MPVTYPDAYPSALDSPEWQRLRLHEDALWAAQDLARLNARVGNLFSAAKDLDCEVIQGPNGVPIGIAPRAAMKEMEQVTAPTLERPQLAEPIIEVVTPEGAQPISLHPGEAVVVNTDKQRFAVLLTAKAAVVNKSKQAIDALKRFGEWSHLNTPIRYIANTFGWVLNKLRWLNPLALLFPFTTQTGQDVVKEIYRGVTAPIRWAAKTAVKGVKWFFGLFGKWGGRVNAKIDKARMWYHDTKAKFFNSRVMSAVKRFFAPKGTAMTVVRGISMSAGVQSFMTGVLGLGSTISMLAYALMAPAIGKVSHETGVTDTVVNTVKSQQNKAKLAQFSEMTTGQATAEEIISSLNEELAAEHGDGVAPVVEDFSCSLTDGTAMTLVRDGLKVRVHAHPDGTTTLTDLITGEVEAYEASKEGLVTPLFPTVPVTPATDTPPVIQPVTGVNSGKVARDSAQASAASKAKEAEDRARAAEKRAKAAQHGPAPKA